MSVLKRQRELRKAEKAARKRAKRHGVQEEGFTEPRPTVRIGELVPQSETSRGADDGDAGHGAHGTTTKEEQG
jgi:hypothetical protein